MEIIDTHTHIYSKEDFGDETEEVVKRAFAIGISHLILPNTNIESISEIKKTIQIDPSRIHGAMGLHPEDVNEDWEKTLQVIMNDVEENKYIGVGEIGIDLYWEDKFKKEQIEVFETQVDYATQKDIPIIIHCRNATEEVLKSLDKFDNKKPRGIFHSFTGSTEEYKQIKKRGEFKFGINGIITFKKSIELQNTVKEIPLSDIVLETDAPYLAPVPHRGKRNESSYIIHTAEKIAEIKNISVDEVAKVTTSTAKAMFNL